MTREKTHWGSELSAEAQRESRDSSHTSYFVQKADPSDSADLSSIVHESHVSLRGGVKLSDFNVTEALEEFPPDVWAESVPDGQTHGVLLIARSLKHNHKQHCSERTSVCYWESHRVVTDDVIPAHGQISLKGLYDDAKQDWNKYIIGCLWHNKDILKLLIILPKASIYRLNSRGPSTEPRGTPQHRGKESVPIER